MGDGIKVYSLGDHGVCASSDLLHDEVGEVGLARNAVFYNANGERGGLYKRRGLSQVNSLPLNGTIYGIAPLSVGVLTTSAAAYVVHAGTKLQTVRIDTPFAVADINLPLGFAMSVRRSRWAVLNGALIVTNGPNQNLRVNISDCSLSTRPLAMSAPAPLPTVVLGAAGVLNGAYQYKFSNIEKVGSATVSESPLSAATSPVTAANQKIEITNIEPWPDPGSCTHVRIYRTTAGGNVFFPLTDVAFASPAAYSDNTPDASLGLVSEDLDLGLPPAGNTTADQLTSIAAWKDRLWAVPSTNPDLLYFSGVKKHYAWSPSNYLTVGTHGDGISGITALIPRRDELGVAKSGSFYKVVGGAIDENGVVDYEVIQVAQNVGCIAPESVVVVNDVAYFHAEDGLYSWGPNGLTNLSKDQVNQWFTWTGGYMRRDQAWQFFGAWAPDQHSYNLFVSNTWLATQYFPTCSAWMSLDVGTGKWCGPHKSSAIMFFSGAASIHHVDPTYGYKSAETMVVGGSPDNTNWYLYTWNGGYSDGSTLVNSPVSMVVTSGVHTGGIPNQVKYFGDVFVLSDSAGASLTTAVTTDLGNPSYTTTLKPLATRIGRCGIGRWLTLTFTHAAATAFNLFGYEVDPVTVVGTR